jgi:hypothetical protein
VKVTSTVVPAKLVLRESGGAGTHFRGIPAFAGMTSLSMEFAWACGPTKGMKIATLVVPAKLVLRESGGAGTHFRGIPAPRLRGDKLRGNDVTFDGAA